LTALNASMRMGNKMLLDQSIRHVKDVLRKERNELNNQTSQKVIIALSERHQKMNGNMIRNVTRVAENVKLLNNKIKLNYTNNYNLKALFQQHATKMIDGDRNTTKNVQWWVMRRLNSSATNEEEKKQRNVEFQKQHEWYYASTVSKYYRKIKSQYVAIKQ
jgi:hypothetical protein